MSSISTIISCIICIIAVPIVIGLSIAIYGIIKEKKKGEKQND